LNALRSGVEQGRGEIARERKNFRLARRKGKGGSKQRGIEIDIYPLRERKRKEKAGGNLTTPKKLQLNHASCPKSQAGLETRGYALVEKEGMSK